MGKLQDFENRLEQIISTAFARTFRSAVEPVEISSALQRELENSAQILSRDRRLVPNQFHVELSPADSDRLSPYGSTLSSELTEMLRDHASQQSYVFTGPVQITFETSEDLTTGRFRVRSQALSSVTPSSRPGAGAAGRKNGAVLEINGVRHPLEPPGLVIGRGSEADLRVDDPGISRRHVEIRVEADAEGELPHLTAIDLGSTNGLLVDGERVKRARLSDGTHVKAGNTTMVVRTVRGSSGGPDERRSHV
ncbi:MAG: DUF3662 and FHA domain-containing protein [Nocardioides sp.]|nr:DUF3662 and FHA domain-containing protein [Nocardioides sp.]